MKKHFLSLSALILASALTACNQIPLEAYAGRGTPESLLDVSSEVVSVELVSEQSVDEIVNWIETDQPTSVELKCFEGDPLCAQTEDMLRLYGLEYEITPAEKTEAVLVYERVIARDCENRYIDNSINPYYLYHPTFGCSVASNLVQMVTDKRQFVSPTLLDYMDATSAIRSYNLFINPKEADDGGQEYSVEDAAGS